MDVATEDDRLIVRLEMGEHVLDALETVRDEHGIESGFLMGIGAVDKVRLGHYDPHTEEYTEETFEEQLEVTSFLGNMGPDKIHTHITLGRRDSFESIAGHCSGARVSGTFEIVIFTGETPLEHTHDPETGLHVFDI